MLRTCVRLRTLLLPSLVQIPTFPPSALSKMIGTRLVCISWMFPLIVSGPLYRGFSRPDAWDDPSDRGCKPLIWISFESKDALTDSFECSQDTTRAFGLTNVFLNFLSGSKHFNSTSDYSIFFNSFTYFFFDNSSNWSFFFFFYFIILIIYYWDFTEKIKCEFNIEFSCRSIYNKYLPSDSSNISIK